MGLTRVGLVVLGVGRDFLAEIFEGLALVGVIAVVAAVDKFSKVMVM